MTAKEKVRNDVLLQMRNHVDTMTLNVLEDVITRVLAGVEVVEIESLPATIDDSNAYVWELFMLKKAPKLSEKTVKRYQDIVMRRKKRRVSGLRLRMSEWSGCRRLTRMECGMKDLNLNRHA